MVVAPAIEVQYESYSKRFRNHSGQREICFVPSANLFYFLADGVLECILPLRRQGTIEVLVKQLIPVVLRRACARAEHERPSVCAPCK